MTTLGCLLQELIDAAWETGWYAGIQEAQGMERLTEQRREYFGKQMQTAIDRRNQARAAVMRSIKKEGMVT